MLSYVPKDILWAIGETIMRYGTLILDAEVLRDISVLTTALIVVNAGVADLRYTVATEACADRAAVGDALQNVTMQNVNNTNMLATAIRDGIQSIKDDLCADRLEAERRENANLRSELMYARGQASQVDQTAQLRASQLAANTALLNELRSCPIPAQAVYGNQPVFTCPQNQGTCGCNGSF